MAKLKAEVEEKEYGRNIHATPRSVNLINLINKKYGIKKYMIVDSAILEYTKKHYADVIKEA